MTETTMHEVRLDAPADPVAEAVWLHGWGLDHRSFLPLATLLKSRLSNRLLDLPGFGRSPALPRGTGTEGYADDLARHLGAGKTGTRVLIGHSFGVRVAMRFAKAYPDAVDAVIAIGGAGIPRDRSLGWKIRAFALRWLGKGARLVDRIAGTQLRDAYVRKFGSADYRNAGDLRETFVAVVREDLTDVAGDVACPVLLIYGADDAEAPPEIGEKYHAVLPQSELVVLPAFGHFDILDRGSHQCQNLITRFLGTLTADGRA